MIYIYIYILVNNGIQYETIWFGCFWTSASDAHWMIGNIQFWTLSFKPWIKRVLGVPYSQTNHDKSICQVSSWYVFRKGMHKVFLKERDTQECSSWYWFLRFQEKVLVKLAEEKRFHQKADSYQEMRDVSHQNLRAKQISISLYDFHWVDLPFLVVNP